MEEILYPLLFLILPILALIYGVVAIVKTIISYRSILADKELTLLSDKEKKIYDGQTPLQKINLILSALLSSMFLSFFLMPVGYDFFYILIAVVLVLLLPVSFVFIGFNVPFIWNKRIVEIEAVSFKRKTSKVVVQKIFLWLTWFLGYTAPLVLFFFA